MLVLVRLELVAREDRRLDALAPLLITLARISVRRDRSTGGLVVDSASCCLMTVVGVRDLVFARKLADLELLRSRQDILLLNDIDGIFLV